MSETRVIVTLAPAFSSSVFNFMAMPRFIVASLMPEQPIAPVSLPPCPGFHTYGQTLQILDIFIQVWCIFDMQNQVCIIEVSFETPLPLKI